MKDASAFLHLLSLSYHPPAGRSHSLELDGASRLCVMVWTSPDRREGFILSIDDFRKTAHMLVGEIINELAKDSAKKKS